MDAPADHTELFTKIYEDCIWGNDNSSDYKGCSGGGASYTFNENTLIPFIAGFITTKGITSVVDIGCGDFQIGTAIFSRCPILYTGVDVYKQIIDRNMKMWPEHNWLRFNAATNPEKLPESDLLIVKDVLQHWCNDEIYDFLDTVIETKKFKYIIIVNCCAQSYNMQDIEREQLNSVHRYRPLTASMFPLKKYRPEMLFNYKTKEVSLITVS